MKLILRNGENLWEIECLNYFPSPSENSVLSMSHYICYYSLGHKWGNWEGRKNKFLSLV